MSGSKLNIALFLLVVWMLSDALPASDTQTQKDESIALSQQQGMDENLADDVPPDDSDDQQALENPRIVVHENLEDLPDVHVISGDDSSTADLVAEQPDEGQSEKDKETIQQLKDELDIDGSDESAYVFLQKTDQLMNLT
jgi:hypothetical protein